MTNSELKLQKLLIQNELSHNDSQSKKWINDLSNFNLSEENPESDYMTYKTSEQVKIYKNMIIN